MEEESADDFPEGAIRVDSSVSGSVWQVRVKEGQAVKAGQLLLVLESQQPG